MDQSTFKCDFCETRCSKKNALLKHYKKYHDEVPESYKALKEKSVSCNNCGKSVKNLTDHNNYCKVSNPGRQTPQSSGRLALAAGVASPSTAMSSLQIEDSGDNQVLPGYISEEAFYKRFFDFVVKESGQKSNTATQYSKRLESFARFIQRTNPDFSWGSTLNFQHDTVEEYAIIPTCNKWVNSHESSANQHGALNAYMKLIDFLKFELFELQHVLVHTYSLILKGKFNDLRENASRLLKKTQTQILPERKARLADQAQLAENSDEVQVPMEEMERACKFYRDCPYRLSMYEQLKDMDHAMKFCNLTAVNIRNFLMLEVLFEVGGQRPECIKNMTIENLMNADTLSTDVEKRVIYISEHKTANTHGLANLIIPLPLFNLLVQYSVHVREKLAADLDDSFEGLLFVSKDTGEKIQRLDQCCKLFAKVTKTEYNIIPKSFRYLVAHLGQKSDDPKIREKLPTHLNHSQSTAQLHYVKEAEKRKEHSEMLTEILGESTNLPEVAAVEGFEESKAKINAAKKAKLEESAQKKDDNFVPNLRHVFSPSEKTLIVNTFKSVQQSNLKKSDYDKALEESVEFRQLVESHREQGKNALKVFTQVANSFRSTRRK